jgi:hypothetical protein
MTWLIPVIFIFIFISSIIFMLLICQLMYKTIELIDILIDKDRRDLNENGEAN